MTQDLNFCGLPVLVYMKYLIHVWEFARYTVETLETSQVWARKIRLQGVSVLLRGIVQRGHWLDLAYLDQGSSLI